MLALQERTQTLFPNDDSPKEISLAWRLPDVVTPELRAEASQHLAAIIGQLQPASPKAISGWLATLGTVTAGTTDGQTIGIKAATMLKLLGDFPPACFTRETLDEATRKFDFFPSFKALADLIEPKRWKMAEIRRRLQAIVEAPPPRTMIGQPTMTDEERADRRAQTDELLADLRAQARESKNERLRDSGGAMRKNLPPNPYVGMRPAARERTPADEMNEQGS